MLGLRFCARASSSCSKWGPLFIAVRGPLTIVASLVVEHRLQTHRLSSCGSRAQLLRGMWDLPRPGLEPMSPALAGRLSTTAPPGKPSRPFLTWRLATLTSLNFSPTVLSYLILQPHTVPVILWTHYAFLLFCAFARVLCTWNVLIPANFLPG